MFNLFDSVFGSSNSRKGAGTTIRQQILNISDGAARIFDDAGLNDSDILTLTREDLNELLPGPHNFKIRRKIAVLINSATQPVGWNSLIEKLKDLTSRQEVKNLLVANGLSEDYLHVLRDAEKHLARSLDFVRQHVSLLESLQGQPLEGASPGAAAGGCSHPCSKHEAHPYLKSMVPPAVGMGPVPPVPPVKIHILVSGKTLGFHADVLRRLKVPVEEVGLEDCQVVLLFCPVTSRAGTDIEAALKEAPGNRDVILVVMHYTYNPMQNLSGMRQDFKPHVREVVHVTFHDSMGGLLNCEANRLAITVVESALKNYTVATSCPVPVREDKFRLPQKHKYSTIY